MKILIDKEDVYLKDLKIPKGYRLIEDYELLKELRVNKELRLILTNRYIFCNSYDNKIRGGFLFNFNNYSNFYANLRIVDNFNRRLRGVFVKVKK